MNKFLVVALLTLLIWAWAYMSQEITESFSGSLRVSPSLDRSRLVTFSLSGSNPLIQIPLTSLNLKGAPSKISDLTKSNTSAKEQFDFYYDPQDRTENTTLDLLDYLQKSSKMKELAVTLQSCSPTEVTVNIEKLIEKELRVKCVDKDGGEIKGFNADPALVKVYVREGYPVETATAVLSPQLIETARKKSVEVTPYVNLGIAGVRRESQTPVKVTLQSQQRLKTHTFQPSSYRFVISESIANDYKIELLSETFTGTTNFLATDEAMEAYKKMPYHIRIEVRNGDEQLPEIPPRPVTYNFPPEHYKNGDIDIVEVTVPKTATFKLVPLNSAVNLPARTG